jgi:hypothetical protein
LKQYARRNSENCNGSLWFYIRFWLPVAAMVDPLLWLIRCDG